MKVCIVVPAYNEEKVIGSVLKAIKKNGYRDIIVVDDASSDRTAEIATGLGAEVVSHPINRGLGGALGTGFAAALENEPGIVVTMDADGQHDPADISRLVKPIAQGRADVVIGSRLIRPRGMPLHRRIGNFGLNLITYMLFGVWTTDSQSGMRAFSADALRKITLRTNRMEVSSEIIREIGRNRLRFCEVPIKPIYTEYSRKHGQSSLNAFRIVAKLVLKKLMR